MWRCCFDKRVLVGLGVVAALVFVVAPGRAVAALPVLIGLVCPLSMLLMMRGMNGGRIPAEVAESVESGREQELARLRQEIDDLQAALRPPGRENDSVSDLGRGHLRAGDHRPTTARGRI